MMKALPLGLVRYRPGMFEKMHACGSGEITASNAAALLGVGKYAGRYALAAHISGRCPLPDADNARTRMGRWLEPVAAGMLAELPQQLAVGLGEVRVGVLGHSGREHAEDPVGNRRAQCHQPR